MRIPTIPQIAEYCKERGNSVDPVAFFHHYEAVGWVIGRNKPMKRWQSAIITWERNTRHPGAVKKREQKCIKEKKELFVPRKKVKANPEIKKLADQYYALGKDLRIAKPFDQGRISRIRMKRAQLIKDMQKLKDNDSKLRKYYT